MKNKRGFTLVELMITMSIIAVLSVVLSVNFSKAQKDSRDQRRVEDLKTIQNAAEQYFLLSGSYPSSAGSWSVGGQSILTKYPVGPKGNADTYSYFSNAFGFCVCSSNMESGKAVYRNADQVNQFPCDFQSSGNNYCVSSQQ
jgi:prepilin-type N-terminal cleavage/methylation domain-containing protein